MLLSFVVKDLIRVVLMFNLIYLWLKVISAALTLLTPATANVLLLSPEHDGLCPLKEKWFGTQYSVEGNPPQRIWETCAFVFTDHRY